MNSPCTIKRLTCVPYSMLLKSQRLLNLELLLDSGGPLEAVPTMIKHLSQRSSQIFSRQMQDWDKSKCPKQHVSAMMCLEPNPTPNANPTHPQMYCKGNEPVPHPAGTGMMDGETDKELKKRMERICPYSVCYEPQRTCTEAYLPFCSVEGVLLTTQQVLVDPCENPDDDSFV